MQCFQNAMEAEVTMVKTQLWNSSSWINIKFGLARSKILAQVSEALLPCSHCLATLFLKPENLLNMTVMIIMLEYYILNEVEEINCAVLYPLKLSFNSTWSCSNPTPNLCPK